MARPPKETTRPRPSLIGKRMMVAETVVRRTAVLRRDQEARLHQLARVGALGDQVILECRAAGGGEAQAEARPLILRQGSALQIVARAVAGGSAQLRLEPLGGEFRPVEQPLTLVLHLRRAGIFGREREPRLRRQPLHRLTERQPLGLLQEADQIAMLAG